jgi:hypothetical protein
MPISLPWLWSREVLTLKDLSAAKKFLKKSYAVEHYSRKQNRLSYELCAMNPVERSDTIEAMVWGLFSNNGYNVYRMGGLKKTYDLWVNEEKVEIKSSLANKCSTRRGQMYYTYTFPGVKPEYFDRLVLAYVTPHGVELNILTKRAVYARIQNGNLTRGAQGYSIYHGKGTRMIGQKFSNFLELTSR